MKKFILKPVCFLHLKKIARANEKMMQKYAKMKKMARNHFSRYDFGF